MAWHTLLQRSYRQQIATYCWSVVLVSILKYVQNQPKLSHSRHSRISQLNILVFVFVKHPIWEGFEGTAAQIPKLFKKPGGDSIVSIPCLLWDKSKHRQLHAVNKRMMRLCVQKNLLSARLKGHVSGSFRRGCCFQFNKTEIFYSYF